MSSTRKPITISVVVPSYNSAAFLRETLESVLAQTHVPLEVIVVDDGSTDDSAAIAESFGRPIRVIKQPNQGESVARNRGIDEAHGEWIAFLDADDLWCPQKLELQIAAAAADPGVVAVHTNVECFGSIEKTLRFDERPEELRYQLQELAVRNSLYPPSALMVRREVSPRFPTWTRYGEDRIYVMELVRVGRVALVNQPLTRYRRHDGGQSARPEIVLHWHETIEEWLRRNQDSLDATIIDAVRARWLKKLAATAWDRKNERRWDEYWMIRRHLEAYRGHSKVDPVLKNRIYPRLFYRMFDHLKRNRRPADQF